MKSLTGILVSLLILVALTAVINGQSGNANSAGSDGNSNIGINSKSAGSQSNLTSERKSFLNKEIDQKSSEYKSYGRRWSFTYHLFLFGGVLLAALAGILAKVTFLSVKAKQDSLVAILAGLAAILPIISTSGNFSSKWQANRIAAYDMENMRYEIEKENVSYDEILTRMQTIIKSRNDTIAGKK